MVVSKEIYIESIKKYVREREYTDYIMPIWLPFIPVILAIISSIWITIVTLITSFSMSSVFKEKVMASEYKVIVEAYRPQLAMIPMAFMSFISFLLIISLIVEVYVLYKWIDRRNKHFKRVKIMFREVLDYLRRVGSGKAEPHVGLAERTLRDAEYEETDRSPIIWIILSIFIPFIIFYIYHFLHKDFYKHEKREDGIADDIGKAVATLGGNEVRIRRVNPIPYRSTILYLVLTIITLGFFGLYWVYTLTVDPNNHFMEHRRWEDELIKALEAL